MKKFLLGAAFLLLLLAASFFAVLVRPSLVVNSKTLGWALTRFGGAYQPRWESLELDAWSWSLREKGLALRAKGFCFADRHGAVEGCLKEVDVRLELRLGRHPRLTRVERFTVLGQHLTLDPSKRPAAAAPPPRRRGLPELPSLLPPSLRALTVAALRVELPRCELRGSSGTLKGDLSAVLRPERARPLVLTAKGSRAGAPALAAVVSLDSDLLREGRLTYLDLEGLLDAGLQGKAVVSARAQESGPGETQFRLSVKGASEGKRLETLWRGVQGPRGYEAQGTARVALSTGPVRGFLARDCAVSIALKPESLKPDSAQARCGFRIEPGAAPGRRALRPFEANASLAARFDGKGRFASELKSELLPAADWYDLRASLKADLSGELARLKETLAIDQTLEASIAVKRFEDLTAFLKDTPLAVPAPLHVLTGPLKLAVSGRGDPRRDAQAFDVSLETDLASQRQRLKLTGKGRLTVDGVLRADRKLSASAELTLADVMLELPRLEVAGMPKVAVDKRIAMPETAGPPAVRRAKAKAPAPAVDLAARVATGKQPLVLRSNLAREPVPVAVDLRVTSPPAALDGTVTLQAFDIELFRRTANVERVGLGFSPASKTVELDGMIHYQTSDARVDIRLIGTAQKPRVELSSEPPMDKHAILSLLLFGKAPSELDSDQQASVGNTSNALATEAFGLASLYLFASTPIEYVGYDPASQSYTVKFRLPGGASLEVGSDFDESRHVRLRKRISSRWAIQTEMRSQTDSGSAVETFLEWFQRY